MLKKCSFLMLILLLLLTGCGKVTKDISSLETSAQETISEDADTLTSSDMSKFVDAVRLSSVIMAEQNSNQGTLVTTEPFQINRSNANGFSTMGISDSYQYWFYETRTRVINGITETVQSQYCFYDTNGQRLDHYRVLGEAFGYVERYLDITSSQYEAHFHEKITYTGANNEYSVIEKFPGSTYPNNMIINGLAMTIGTRTISYDSLTHNGSGTMDVSYSTMSGSLAINIVNNVFSVDGYLNKSGKKALHLVIQNNNQSSLTFVLNKSNPTEYYYTELNLLSADLVDRCNIEIMDSSSYTTNLLLYQVSYVTINAAAGQTPWLNSNSSYILRVNDCDHINISGVNFENTANGSSYNYLYLSLTSYFNLSDCSFRKSVNRTSNFIRIKNVDHATVKNSSFQYTLGNKKSTGILLYTANIDQNVLLQNNTFTGLNYGIYFNVGSAGNPAVTVESSVFQNNQYGIYRTNTGYTFNNINNTFSGNSTNIR